MAGAGSSYQGYHRVKENLKKGEAAILKYGGFRNGFQGFMVM
jgi:hypothetical protein